MLAAVRAYVAADAREQKAQAIQKLARSAERGTHAWHRWALVQRERRGHVANVVDRGFAGLRDAASRVGRKRFEVAARAFGVEHAERERAFARTRYARNAHELAERNVHVHVLQIVHARAAHFDVVDVLHDFLRLRARVVFSY